MPIELPVVRQLDSPRSELGEGPHYDPELNTVWWFDILGKRLFEYRLDDDHTITHSLPRMGSVIARIDVARQLLVLDDGIYLRKRDTGELTLLAPLEADKLATRSNDGRVHPSGRLWIGTMGRQAEAGAGAIYWYDGREVRCLYEQVTIPNSICFSPDGEVAYFADTWEGCIWRVPVDPTNGLPRGDREVFLTSSQLPAGGGFDGSVVDADGALWNAAFGGGCISGFSPDGALIQTIRIPARQVTCPCFVGQKLDEMLVTSAWEGYDSDQRELDPAAGLIHVIEGGFQGLPDPRFLVPG